MTQETVYLLRADDGRLFKSTFRSLGPIKNCLRSNVTNGCISRFSERYDSYSCTLTLQEVNDRLKKWTIHEITLEPLSRKDYSLLLDENDEWIIEMKHKHKFNAPEAHLDGH